MDQGVNVAPGIDCCIAPTDKGETNKYHNHNKTASLNCPLRFSAPFLSFTGETPLRNLMSFLPPNETSPTPPYYDYYIIPNRSKSRRKNENYFRKDFYLKTLTFFSLSYLRSQNLLVHCRLVVRLNQKVSDAPAALEYGGISTVAERLWDNRRNCRKRFLSIIPAVCSGEAPVIHRLAWT